jgi:hypothetical protein
MAIVKRPETPKGQLVKRNNTGQVTASEKLLDDAYTLLHYVEGNLQTNDIRNVLCYRDRFKSASESCISSSQTTVKSIYNDNESRVQRSPSVNCDDNSPFETNRPRINRVDTHSPGTRTRLFSNDSSDFRSIIISFREEVLDK